MELLIALVVVVLIAALLYAVNRDDGSLEAYLQEAGQVNRTALLSLFEPRLALDMAQGLQGEARQLALHQVAPALLRAGEEQAALTALAELRDGYQQSALDNMLEHYLEAQDPHAALSLLERLERPLPESPLLQIPLLLACGQDAQASAQLDTLTQQQEQGTGQSLSGPQNLILAGLQRRLQQPQAALRSLERAWELLAHPEPDTSLPLHDLKTVLTGLAELGEVPRALALARQLPVEEQGQAVLALMEGGQTEAAFELLADLGEQTGYFTHTELMDHALATAQPDTALRVVDCAPVHHYDELLLRLVDWHAEQGDLAQANALLDSRAHEPGQRIWLLLTLWERNLGRHPSWADELRRQALAELERIRGEDNWGWLRLFALEGWLRQQAALPAHQRDAYGVRTHLEEIEQLNAALDLDGRVTKLAEQAPLLRDLGEAPRARRWVEACLVTLDDAQQAEALEDDEDLGIYLEAIGLAYLALGDTARAQALQARLQAMQSAERRLDEALLLDHIRHGRFEDAIASLSLTNVMREENPLAQLHQAIDRLQAEDPPRAAALRQQLLETLNNGLVQPLPVAA